jgi:hypothetical protein
MFWRKMEYRRGPLAFIVFSAVEVNVNNISAMNVGDYS